MSYRSITNRWASIPAFCTGVPQTTGPVHRHVVLGRLSHTAGPVNPPVELKLFNYITSTYLYALLVGFDSTFKLAIILADMLISGDKALSAEKWMFDQSKYNTINFHKIKFLYIYNELTTCSTSISWLVCVHSRGRSTHYLYALLPFTVPAY